MSSDTSEPLARYGEDLHQAILRLEDDIGLSEQAYVTQLTDILADFQVVNDTEVAFYRARGIQVNGFSIDREEDRLDLFITINSGFPADRLGQREINAAFSKLKLFLQACYDGLYEELEVTSEAYDMAKQIWELREVDITGRAFLLTNGISTGRTQVFEDELIKQTLLSFHVWDLDRFHRLESSTDGQEEIDIDLRRFTTDGLSVLNLGENDDYRAFFTVVPATLLYAIYDEYGPRLLERNVRSFLQARGAVNRGIRDTIINEPTRFIAYNNGLSATADEVELNQEGTAVIRIKGLQIVNGAQTTASIHTAVQRDRQDVASVHVQMKLIEVPPTLADELVPRISQYANSQNAINRADFSANDPFHVTIEQLARTMWAPAADGSQRETHWFYERARGQYSDEKARARTPARRKAFERDYPPRQKFTKTDLSKYEHCWQGLPYLVARGAQKNFTEYMIRLGDSPELPNQAMFKSIIARQILFKTTDRIVRDQKYGGWKAQIVAYTVSLFAKKYGGRVDLNTWWVQQSLPVEIESALQEIADQVFEIISRKAGEVNVGEWCKSEDCWQAMQDSVTFSKLTFKKHPDSEQDEVDIEKDETVSVKETMEYTTVYSLASEDWFEVASWAKENDQLESWQRGIAGTIGKWMSRDRRISAKMAKQGSIILGALETMNYPLSENTLTLLDDLNQQAE